MQIVIDIPEHIYESVKAMQVICGGGRFSGKTYLQILINSVQNGTPLPKGHGKLVDADAFFEDICNDINVMTKIGIAVDGDWLWEKLDDALGHAPTIIEADKESKEEDE